MALPLAGINVVDTGQLFFWPGTAIYLADQGAEIIRIETMRGGSGVVARLRQRGVIR